MSLSPSRSFLSYSSLGPVLPGITIKLSLDSHRICGLSLQPLRPRGTRKVSGKQLHAKEYCIEFGGIENELLRWLVSARYLN